MPACLHTGPLPTIRVVLEQTLGMWATLNLKTSPECLFKCTHGKPDLLQIRLPVLQTPR